MPVPGISSSWATWTGERGDCLFDPGGEGVDLGGRRVGPGQRHGQQKRVVPGECLLQTLVLRASCRGPGLPAPPGCAAGDEGGQHVAAGFAEDIGDHGGEFHLGFQQSLGALPSRVRSRVRVRWPTSPAQ